MSILARSACLDELKREDYCITDRKSQHDREINILYHNDFKHVDILENIMKEYNKVANFTHHSSKFIWNCIEKLSPLMK